MHPFGPGGSLFGKMRKANVGRSDQAEAESPRCEAPRGGWLSSVVDLMQTLLHEHRALSKTVRRQGHAQECFREQMAERFPEISEINTEAGTARPTNPAEPQKPGLTKIQIEALTRLDQACKDILRPEAGRGTTAHNNPRPRTSNEAVAMLQVRVRNLQRSFGIDAVESEGRAFDDRLHQVHSVCERDNLADGIVVEEILPGYTLNGKVIRPAVVVVNRRPRS